jgi:hypothetical protein
MKDLFDEEEEFIFVPILPIDIVLLNVALVNGDLVEVDDKVPSRVTDTTFNEQYENSDF